MAPGGVHWRCYFTITCCQHRLQTLVDKPEPPWQLKWSPIYCLLLHKMCFLYPLLWIQSCSISCFWFNSLFPGYTLPCLLEILVQTPSWPLPASQLTTCVLAQWFMCWSVPPGLDKQCWPQSPQIQVRRWCIIQSEGMSLGKNVELPWVIFSYDSADLFHCGCCCLSGREKTYLILGTADHEVAFPQPAHRGFGVAEGHAGQSGLPPFLGLYVLRWCVCESGGCWGVRGQEGERKKMVSSFGFLRTTI